MARYVGPVNKRMRFLGLEVPRKPGKGPKMNSRRRLSPYGLQLREKQKARFLYGILERQFRNYYDKASKDDGSTGDSLLILLEKRFDNVMYRTGMFNTRRQSRQAVNHGHFLINDKKVNIEMTLTSPNCPVAESLPKMVKDNILSVEGVSDVDLKLVWSPPWTKDKMSEAAKLELNL